MRMLGLIILTFLFNLLLCFLFHVIIIRNSCGVTITKMEGNLWKIES